MPKLTWSSIGERYYELGVDHGVLFVDDNPGVAWSGIISIDENPSGGDAQPYYLDGVKYLNLAAKEEFEATLNAFYSPPEFDACEGVGLVRPGLFASQQRRKPFGLTYRTMIGNDIEGPDYGYKIHIVYNALAAPTQRSYASFSDNVEAPALSWAISTKPVPIPGMQRSAHLTVDTTTAPAYSIELLESILYGDASTPPRLPTPDEVVSMFSNASSLVVTDNGDGTFVISGSDLSVRMISDGTYQIMGDTVVGIDVDRAEISSE